MPEATVDGGIESWSCARCEVTVQWMAGHEKPDHGIPAHWIEEDGVLYCLGCRRERAAEAGGEAAPDGTSLADRTKLQSHARIEFEITRDPARSNSEIARACRTSGTAVGKARERLGLPPS